MEPTSEQLMALLATEAGNGLRRTEADHWEGREFPIPQVVGTSVVETCRQAGWLVDAPDPGQIAGAEWTPVVLTNSGISVMGAALRPVEYPGCRLDIELTEGGYQVRIQPHTGVKVKPSVTRVFSQRAEVISNARFFIDNSLS